MEIRKHEDNGKLVVELVGRLDTTTAPELEKELGDLAGVSELVLDFKELAYISSAGLRVLLAAQKAITKLGGSMLVKNVNDEIMEVFEITGFIDILTIEK